MTNKKMQSVSTHNVKVLSSIKTKMSVVSIRMTTEISSIQNQIYAQGQTPLLTSATVTKISYPFTGTISAGSGLKGAAEKIRILKALFANRNGLESTMKSIEAAIESTSTTGTAGSYYSYFLLTLLNNFSASIVLNKAKSITAIANCLYGDDLKETVLQKMAAEIVKVFSIIPFLKLSNVSLGYNCDKKYCSDSR